MTIKTKIGMGLAALGRPEYINIRENKNIDKTEKAFRENAFSVLDFAYEKGIRYYDTAPSYGKGERYLMDWNNDRKHSDVILGTKWGYTYVANWELGYYGKHEIKEHSLDKLLEQWEVSQELLPKLNIYQIHSATLETGVLQNDAILNKLYQLKKETGIQIGLTTSGENQNKIILEALNIKINNDYLFDSFQVTYNILEQSTFEVLNILKSKSKFIIIKEALANGRIFNKENKATYSLLENLALKYNVGIDAIVIRFVIDSIEPNYVLSGASNIHQLEENLKALHPDLILLHSEMKQLSLLRTNPVSYWEERNRLTWN
ncbi:aldo/keto reductase [Flavobacterium sp.]|uniref:aldo/keto reductase n=1 Tax=Flavobacterium sp. TaxID=239 RepID=UPI003C598FE4